MNYAHVLLVSSAIAWSGSVLAGDDEIFLENEGTVVMEVESRTPGDGWSVKTEIDGYLGSSYFEWTGPNHFNAGSAGNGTVVYSFRILTPGNYQMRWRNRIAEGTSSTESNDSWLRLATGQNIADEQALNGWTKVYMNRKNTWSWDSRTVDHVGNPIRQFFSAGDHTLEISGRSAGHAIDRIVLYKYDEVNYTNARFNGYAESATTTEPWDGNPDGDPDPDPDPAVPDWSTDEITQTANTCLQNVVSLTPSADLYLQNNIVIDNDSLRIDAEIRTTLLQFDLAVIPQPVASASLVLTVGSDSGNGAIIVSSGDHSDWSERDTGFDRPDNSLLLGSFDGNWNTNEHYALPLDPTLLGSDKETLLLEMSVGGDDLSLKSRSTDAGPRLQLSGGTDFCTAYATLVAQAAQDREEAERENAEPGDSTIDPDPQDNNPDVPEVDIPEVTLPDIDSSTGAAQFLVLLLLASRLQRRRRKHR